jgi:hypothetical protein
MDVNERRHFEKMIRDLGFPASATRALDQMYRRPGEAYELRCKTLGIAFPRDASEINLTLKFSALPDGRGFLANSYSASISHRPSRSIREYTFPIMQEGTKNVDEAFALLDGRCVRQRGRGEDGQWRAYWERLDFKTRDERGQYRLVRYDDYDLERAMSKVPFTRQLDESSVKGLCEQLQMGEAPEVMLKSGQVYLIANPAGKDLLVSNSDGKILHPETLKPRHSIYNVIRSLRRKRGKGM